MRTWTGKRIQQLRKRHGITQDELAKALGTIQARISEWERDVHQPGRFNRSMLEKIELEGITR